MRIALTLALMGSPAAWAVNPDLFRASTMPGGGTAAAVGDFNGDRKPDLVVASEGSAHRGVRIRLGNGDGTFGDLLPVDATYSCGAIAAGDFNRDGFDDIAAIDTGVTPNRLLIHISNGIGTFRAPVAYPVGARTRLVKAVDLDDDRSADVIVGDSAVPRILLFKSVAGGLLEPRPAIEPTLSGEVAVGDVTGDGRPDLAVSRPPNGIQVLLNDGNFRFLEHRNILGGGSWLTFDGSGQRYLFAINPGAVAVSLLSYSVESQFGGAVSGADGNGAGAVLAAHDWNRDGRGDVVIGFPKDNRISILFGRGLLFDGGPRIDVLEPGHLTVADVNGDGDPDLVASNPTRESTTVLINAFRGAPCAYDIAQPIVLGPQGGQYGVGAKLLPDCKFTIGALPSWIQAGRDGALIVDSTDVDREGEAQLGGQTVKIVQRSSSRITRAVSAGTGALLEWERMGDVRPPGRVEPRWYSVEIRSREDVVYAGRQTHPYTDLSVDLPAGNYVASVSYCFESRCWAPTTARLDVAARRPQAAPTITDPQDGSTLRGPAVMSWTAVAGAARYEVVVEDAGGTPVARTGALGSESSTTLVLPAGERFLARVRACQDECGPWSQCANYSVVLPTAPREAPVLTYADVDAENLLDSEWTAVPEADSYQVLVVVPGAGPGGGALTTASGRVDVPRFTRKLARSESAAVIVAACNAGGCGPSGEGRVVSPNTRQDGFIRIEPAIASPVDGATVQAPRVDFSWNNVPPLSTVPTMYRLIVRDLTRNALALDVLVREPYYAARFNGGGRRYEAVLWAGFVRSAPTYFSVTGPDLEAPLVVSPRHQHAAIDVFRGRDLVGGPQLRTEWTPVEGASKYEFGSGHLSGVTVGNGVTTTLRHFDMPAAFGAMVRACPTGAVCEAGKNGGWGPWSELSRYTVKSDGPGPATVGGP